ncbi:MAG: hypothetical protein ACI8V2_003348 [Candidatus Latescibacterota bacterium]|jgi:hypothetical protein
MLRCEQVFVWVLMYDPFSFRSRVREYSDFGRCVYGYRVFDALGLYDTTCLDAAICVLLSVFLNLMSPILVVEIQVFKYQGVAICVLLSVFLNLMSPILVVEIQVFNYQDAAT